MIAIRHILAGMVAAFLILLAAMASAQTYNWGNTPGDRNYESDGVTVWTNTFHYELGTFTLDYDPTMEDPTTWGFDWITIDTATYNPDAGWFSDNHVFNDNTYAGRRAYLFVYNNLVGDDSSEWFLATDPAWMIPNGGGAIGLPVEWRLDNAAEILFGQTDSAGGAGEFDAPLADMNIQSGTFLPVPEASTTGLASLMVAGLLLRRRRPFF